MTIPSARVALLAAYHQLYDLVVGCLRRLARAGLLAMPKDDDLVGDFENIAQVVRDEDDPLALRTQGLNQRQHAALLGDAERSSRLVHDDEPCVPVERPPDGDRLALPAGKGGDWRVEPS